MAESDEKDKCPKCGAPLGELTETPNGRKLRRCSKGFWDPQTKKNEGCPYVQWVPVEPKPLDEKCPKCGAPLVLQVTRFGKKMKRCSKGGWDRETKQPTGCDYVEWINGTTQPLDEKCPDCGQPLVFFTSSTGKKMIKCSTSGWDRVARKATGCPYIRWLKPGEEPGGTSTGEEFLPPEPS